MHLHKWSLRNNPLWATLENNIFICKIVWPVVGPISKKALIILSNVIQYMDKEVWLGQRDDKHAPLM